jgi:hypothetical protein
MVTTVQMATMRIISQSGISGILFSDIINRFLILVDYPPNVSFLLELTKTKKTNRNINECIQKKLCVSRQAALKTRLSIN